jgi:hypothetical protein
MKYNIIVATGVFLGSIGFSASLFAQCKSSSEGILRPFYDLELECAKTNSDPSYLSDARDYRAMLSGNQTAQFSSVFYAGNTYRIAACTDIGAPLSFTVKDHVGNVLFTNKEHENAPFWDLEFPATINCEIFIQLPPETQELVGGGETAEEEVVEETDASAEADSSETTEGEQPKEVKEKVKVCSVLVIGYKQ